MFHNEISKLKLDTNSTEFVKSRKEILYEGYFYDVTDFIRSHPGGTLIEFYTEPGEDATQAIGQFHFRAKNKVKLLMKSLKSRPDTPENFNPNHQALTRHEEMSKDFKDLFEQLKEEGFFEPSYRHVFLRFLEALAITMLGIGLLLLHPLPTHTKILSCILTGLGFSRFGWVEHEGGHRSLTGNKKIDQFLQDISMCLALGGSSVWWNSQHNRHHAMPQRLQHDVDLASLPLVAFNKREVTQKGQVNQFFMKYQGFLYWTVDLFLGIIAWQFYIHPRCQLRKQAYFEMFLKIPSILFMYHVGLHWYFLYTYFFALFFGLNFALSHSHLEVADTPTHWIEYSLTHTANIKPSIWCDWWMGYLNYQIEHHLFPTMPQFRQGEINGRVRALAEKHGLPYMVFSYPEACRLAVKNLYDVGKELSTRDWDIVDQIY